MKYLNLLFVVFLISNAFSLQTHSQVSLEAQAEAATALANRIYITVDNVLDAIVISNTSGSTSVNLSSVPGLASWPTVKNIYAVVRDGDTITIAGHNISGPYGILACIHYRDQLGIDHKVCTGKGWTCNGQLAKLLGKNGVLPWGPKPFIDINAQWIWSPNPDQYVKCSYTIKPVPNIFVDVDNELINVSVAGNSINLASAPNKTNWHLADSLYWKIKEGDLLSITGRNYGTFNLPYNPGALIGSFHYLDKFGIHRIINTNARWSCNKRGAFSYGPNGVSPWGPIALIQPQAEWIWSKNLKDQYSTCTFRVPYTKFPPNIFVFATAVLSKLSVNGLSVDLNGASTALDKKTKGISYDIQEGDEVEFEASDNGQDLPNALLVSIHYIDSEGNVQVASSNENWICNSDKAAVLGKNGDKLLGSIREVAPDARFISDNSEKESKVLTCKFHIPVLDPNILPNIFFSAENSFTSIRVNGAELDLSNADYLNDSTKADSVYSPIAPGDFIELSAILSIVSKRIGGIIASIHYLDNFGQPQILNTSANWTCNGSPALDEALNGEDPFAPIESIESDASWIRFQRPILPPQPEITAPPADAATKPTSLLQTSQDTSSSTTPEDTSSKIAIDPIPKPAVIAVTCSIKVPKSPVLPYDVDIDDSELSKVDFTEVELIN